MTKRSGGGRAERPRTTPAAPGAGASRPADGAHAAGRPDEAGPRGAEPVDPATASTAVSAKAGPGFVTGGAGPGIGARAEPTAAAADFRSGGLSGALGRAVAFGRREIGVLSIVLLVALALFGFLSIADEVAEGETRAFDETLLLALRAPGDSHDPLGPGWLEEAARDVTALGGTTVVTLVTLAVIGFLFADGRPRTAGLVAVSVGGGMLLTTLLKLGFARPRPDLVPHAVEVYTASFPSGHATAAAVAYLTLGGLLSWSQKRRRVKITVLTIAVALTVLVGASRVYLGVHWPTDVIAGWCVGAGWALACSAVAILVARRRVVEPPG